jgi:uncharacterized protein DUF6247
VAIVVGMTAAATRPLFVDASPAEIRAALIPEEQSKFDREYRRALQVTAETFSLEELDETLESWRRIAWMCTDADCYRRMWRRSRAVHPRGHRRRRGAAGHQGVARLLNVLYTVGVITYLIMEDMRRVDVLDVLWAG